MLLLVSHRQLRAANRSRGDCRSRARDPALSIVSMAHPCGADLTSGEADSDIWRSRQWAARQSRGRGGLRVALGHRATGVGPADHASAQARPEPGWRGREVRAGRDGSALCRAGRLRLDAADRCGCSGPCRAWRQRRRWCSLRLGWSGVPAHVASVSSGGCLGSTLAAAHVSAESGHVPIRLDCAHGPSGTTPG